MKFEEFSNIKWLHSIWQPGFRADVIVVKSPEEFYEQIYRSPYEDWCVEAESAVAFSSASQEQ